MKSHSSSKYASTYYSMEIDYNPQGKEICNTETVK